MQLEEAERKKKIKSIFLPIKRVPTNIDNKQGIFHSHGTTRDMSRRAGAAGARL